jgi:hypothetical protein
MSFLNAESRVKVGPWQSATDFAITGSKSAIDVNRRWCIKESKTLEYVILLFQVAMQALSYS